MDMYMYSHAWKAEVSPLGTLKWGGTFQTWLPAKLKSPPLQAQVWGVHAGPTQLYMYVDKENKHKPPTIHQCDIKSDVILQWSIKALSVAAWLYSWLTSYAQWLPLLWSPYIQH